MNVNIFPVGALKNYTYTVIFARYNNKWLYARHKKRDTFETAGGHIEPGETPEDCAMRELYEETGALTFKIRPIFDYAVQGGTKPSNGQVFLAEVETLGALPESEMAEVMECAGLPEKITYPEILPVLYGKLIANL